jgi:Predicted solute binding protein
MKARIAAVALTLSVVALADTLTKKDGSTVDGTFVGGDSRQVRMLVGDSVQSFAISDITSIRFGTSSTTTSTSTTSSTSTSTAASASSTGGNILRPTPDASTGSSATTASVKTGVEIPSGTAIVVRMIDDINSERDQVGQTFRASLDEPIMINGETVVPRGVDVVVKLVDDKESGRLSGRTELTLDLVSMVVNGRTIDIDTAAVTQASESRTKQTATRAGAGAAIGAVIGAIAGGGKGAAIGAATGAGAGTAVQVLTKGQRVSIPSETRLQFTLQQPVKL